MGTRRSSNYGKLIRKSRIARRKIKNVEKALEQDRPAKIVVETAIDVITATQPAIGMLIATYKVSKVVYDISTKTYEEYQKTGNPNAAIQKGAEVALKHIESQVIEYGLSAMIDVGWATIKKEANLKTTEMQDLILKKAAKNTIKEVIFHEKT